MNGDMLLGSNIIIDVFRGKEDAISRIRKIKEIYVPVIVIGELYFGANKSDQTPKRILEIERLEKTVIILEVGRTTAQIYGEIKDQLRAKGRPIPENDIWIAAIAKEHDLPLLTKDKHFENIEGIALEGL